ncbi:hypothetical protein QR680_007198 [Steinernema hermaphroditum]|uniref:G-protein coupled receptors family 1 profile domain-containing protein n=1 Tax=Steinernema hermaphroditum TaxID=289476 RepID=A0AA39LYQ7_9BILA|nr:hypothetical protein QR680_007198 [Steinernema hermaphroditum]
MVFAVFLASYLTVCVGIVGLIINVNVALAVRKCRNFGYAFGTLCLSQTISNIGNCLVFSFLTGGITLVNSDWHYTYVGRRSGQLLVFFWEASIFAHLSLAINRAIAVNFPLNYVKLFNKRRTTNVIVGIIWIIAAAQALPYSLPACSMQFNPETYTYSPVDSLCGRLVSRYGDLYVSIINRRDRLQPRDSSHYLQSGKGGTCPAASVRNLGSAYDTFTKILK